MRTTRSEMWREAASWLGIASFGLAVVLLAALNLLIWFDLSFSLVETIGNGTIPGVGLGAIGGIIKQRHRKWAWWGVGLHLFIGLFLLTSLFLALWINPRP
ncbi:hypothetical protein [Brevibacillus thermoruber]|uniref:hypothetical protein n=1 Tax=Brevibacillus thermoruber TaxID=33942 RepID=UPI0003F6B0B0|nr:hypothetical protein [Brevibacillus thermoruber]